MAPPTGLMQTTFGHKSKSHQEEESPRKYIQRLVWGRLLGWGGQMHCWWPSQPAAPSPKHTHSCFTTVFPAEHTWQMESERERERQRHLFFRFLALSLSEKRLTHPGKGDHVGTRWQRSLRIRMMITHACSPLALAFWFSKVSFTPQRDEQTRDQLRQRPKHYCDNGSSSLVWKRRRQLPFPVGSCLTVSKNESSKFARCTRKRKLSCHLLNPDPGLLQVSQTGT